MVRTERFTVSTPGRGLFDITERVQRAVESCGVAEGLCTVFLHHTSASLLIGENADPSVQEDLERFFARLVPDGDRLFQHVAEGPDDMPSHVRSVLTGVSLSIPVLQGRCALGTWQGIYLYEHRRRAHVRTVSVTVVG